MPQLDDRHQTSYLANRRFFGSTKLPENVVKLYFPKMADWDADFESKAFWLFRWHFLRDAKSISF
jgi:hypothetical protein